MAVQLMLADSQRGTGILEMIDGGSKAGRLVNRRTVLGSSAAAASMLCLDKYAALAGRRKGVAAGRPNILFVCLDDVGRDGLPFYPRWGNEQVPAGSLDCPNMDAFARDADTRIFDRMRSTPICWTTRMEAMSGKKTWELGALMDSHTGKLLLKDQPTDLAYRYLTGYRKAAFGKWHLQVPVINPARSASLAGLDEWGLSVEHPQTNARQLYWGSWWVSNRPGDGSRKERLPEDRFVDDEGVDRTVEFVTQQTARGADDRSPWYCQFWYNLTHEPTVDMPGQPRGDDNFEDVSKFGAMISYADFLFGRIVKALKDTGQYDNTLIILTSDNGGNGFAGGSKGDLSERGIGVPFLVRLPGMVEGGREQRLAQLTDIFPTITHLAGNPQVRQHSRPLFELFNRGNTQIHDHIAMITFNRNWMVADHRWKLRTPWQCRWKQHAESCQDPVLFDLLYDPHETNMISPEASGPGDVPEVKEAYQRLLAIAQSHGLYQQSA